LLSRGQFRQIISVSRMTAGQTDEDPHGTATAQECYSIAEVIKIVLTELRRTSIFHALDQASERALARLSTNFSV
jgi:hypothetical protein